MIRRAVLLVVLAIVVAPASASGATICAGAEMHCIPQAAGWEAREQAAVIFWTHHGGGSDRPYGAAGEPMPYWCDHGLTYERHVVTWAKVEAGEYTPMQYIVAAWTGLGRPNCFIAFNLPRWFSYPPARRCVIFLHEWGHLIGWLHEDAGRLTWRGMDVRWQTVRPPKVCRGREARAVWADRSIP